MIKKLKKLLALTILAAASASCSQVFLFDDGSNLEGDMKIVVTGVVSDVVTNKPIQDITITFSAFAENSISVLPLISKTIRTDENGVYLIDSHGFNKPVTCIITAESTELTGAQYKKMENKVVVKWNGSSYDEASKTFYVNDCNFQMKKY